MHLVWIQWAQGGNVACLASVLCYLLIYFYIYLYIYIYIINYPEFKKSNRNQLIQNILMLDIRIYTYIHTFTLVHSIMVRIFHKKKYLFSIRILNIFFSLFKIMMTKGKSEHRKHWWAIEKSYVYSTLKKFWRIFFTMLLF